MVYSLRNPKYIYRIFSVFESHSKMYAVNGQVILEVLKLNFKLNMLLGVTWK